MKITDILLAEHLVFHHIFDHIERELPKLRTLAEIKTLVRLLEHLLQDHSQTEDDLVLASAGALFGTNRSTGQLSARTPGD